MRALLGFPACAAAAHFPAVNKDLMPALHHLALIVAITAHTTHATLQRDGSLADLARWLNQPNHTAMFQRWTDSPYDYVAFLAALEPWTTAPPAFLLPHPPPLQLPPVPVPAPNCRKKKYSDALTGAPLATPRLVVDFISFGYDLDLLEVRFLELWDEVTAFVVYESPFAQSGLPKPLYFQAVMRTPRFQPFLRKVIHLVAPATPALTRLAAAVAAVERKTLPGRVDHVAFAPQDRQLVWMLEKAMRTEAVERFKQLDDAASPLKAAVMAALGADLRGGNGTKSTSGGAAGSHVWAIQSDADEIITAEALRYHRHCQLKPHVKAVYAPCTAFKKNYHWLLPTFDLRECYPQRDAAAARAAAGHTHAVAATRLARHLWRGGPTLWPLHDILAAGSTLRGRGFSCLDRAFAHLGLGAASHLSSVAEPSLYFHKRGGVVEQHHLGAVPPALLAAGRAAAVTPQHLFAVIQPWCGRKQLSWAVHVTTLPAHVQAAVNDSVPRVVRLYPERYPFLLPGGGGLAALRPAGGSSRNRSRSYVGLLFVETASPAWQRRCTQPNATTF